MRFSLALAAAASLAFFDVADARLKTTWAKRRVEHTKYKLERTYGRGLTGLFNEEGKFQHERISWARDHHRMGQSASLSVDLGNGLILDATSTEASILGFVVGLQYEGISSADDILTADSQVELSNCFASMFALLGSFETAIWNIQNIASERGTFRLFDVAVLDPLHILMDTTVNYEMCEVANIIGQFEAMAGLDYAAISDNLSREVLVIAIESPEARTQMNNLREAAECASAPIQAAQESFEGEGTEDCYDESGAYICEGNPDQGSEENWNFQADPSTEEPCEGEGCEEEFDYAGAANEVVDCFKLVDRYEIGKIGGRLTGKFFNLYLETV